MSKNYLLENYRGAPIYSICPKCHTKSYRKYMRSCSRSIVHDNVGKCELAQDCNYHYSPEEYYKLAPFDAGENFEKSLARYYKNNLYLYLRKSFGEAKADKAMEMYIVGTCGESKTPGGTIFWYKDRRDKIQEGTIMLFDKYTGEGKQKDYVSRSLKMEKFSSQGYLFGEHLLKEFPNKTIVIVEDEITAIKSSCEYADYLWVCAPYSGRSFNIEIFGLPDREIICEPTTWHKKYSNLLDCLTSI